MIYSKDNLTIEVSEHGAELTRLRKEGREYLWNGDAAYWNRHSPVLFPVVGKPYNNELHIDGKTYPMKQHGFARDSEFEQVESKWGICFRMKDTERFGVYPYRFGLEVTYSIQGDKLTVSWYVENMSERLMYYQIGAHPAFLYSSTMHGWEVVCYYTMLHLADYILHNATTDSAVQRLLDNVDLYICPLENPDGTYHLTNDLILKDNIHSTYHNYNDVQLNRNYPYLPGIEGAANIQPETQAIIDWVTPIHFVMSVNFHCGAEIVNYPWDAWTTAQRPHADADWFRYTGQNYASLCHAIDTAYLYGDYRGRSVIEGADWSDVVGSRQDYMTYYQRCREVTIEMSYQSVITDTLVLPTFWDKSKDALLSYATECSYGFWGTVTDAITGEPVEAMIKVVNHDYFNSEVFSHLPLGVYHRPIMAGTYTVEVSAPCYQTATFTVTTRPGIGIRHDVELLPQVDEPVAFDQYILAGMQTTVVALSQNEVWWYDSDTATQPIAIGNYFATPELFDTTTYYLEEHYQDDTLLCVSSRSSVTVYVIDTTSLNSIPEIQNLELKIYPNPTSDLVNVQLTIDNEQLNGIDIQVFDVYARLLEVANMADARGASLQTTQIDLSQYAKGVYFVKAVSKGKMIAVRKVVKK